MGYIHSEAYWKNRLGLSYRLTLPKAEETGRIAVRPVSSSETNNVAKGFRIRDYSELVKRYAPSLALPF